MVRRRFGAAAVEVVVKMVGGSGDVCVTVVVDAQAFDHLKPLVFDHPAVLGVSVCEGWV